MSATTSGHPPVGPDLVIPPGTLSTNESSYYEVPAEPLVTIEGGRSWEAVNPRHFWTYRELIYFLALRDLKVRYKQTALGIVWVVLQPILTTIVFTVILGRLARVPSDGVPYLLFAYAGLMLWSFFSGAITNTGNSLVGNAHIITKVYFPRFIIPVASILARLVDLLVGGVILFALMIYFQSHLAPRILLAPLVVLLLALLALAFGMWTSALNVKYRDVSLALPVLIQLWMFVSPIVYPLSLIPTKWQPIYSLNPLVGIIDTFRALIFGRTVNLFALGVSVTVTVGLLIYAAYTFRTRERTFADIV